MLTLGLATHANALTVRDGTNISRAIPSEQNMRTQANTTTSRSAKNITSRTAAVSSRVATTRDKSGVVARVAAATGGG